MCACAQAHDHIQIQRHTEKQRKFFFLPYIYSGRKKQLTSNVDNEATKKERVQLNERAQQQQNNTSEKRVELLFLQDSDRKNPKECNDDQSDQ